MKAMFLAAGEGTRLRPYTNILPKPAIPFLNVPLFAFNFKLLHSLAIKSFVFNHYHLGEKLKNSVQEWPYLNRYSSSPIYFSDESSKLLGSGGGVVKAKDHLIGDDSILIANADEIILPNDIDDILKFRNFYYEKKPLSVLLTMKHPEAGKKFGAVWVDGHNKVYGFGKVRPNAQVELFPRHFIGIQIVSDRIFNYLPGDGIESNILYDGLVQGIANHESVLSFNLDCHWFETGNPDDFLDATQTCLNLLSKDANEYLKRLLFDLAPNSRLLQMDNSLVFAAGDLQNFSPVGFAVIGENVKFKNKTVTGEVVIQANQEITSVIQNRSLVLRA